MASASSFRRIQSEGAFAEAAAHARRERQRKGLNPDQADGKEEEEVDTAGNHNGGDGSKVDSGDSSGVLFASSVRYGHYCGSEGSVPDECVDSDREDAAASADLDDQHCAHSHSHSPRHGLRKKKPTPSPTKKYALDDSALLNTGRVDDRSMAPPLREPFKTGPAGLFDLMYRIFIGRFQLILSDYCDLPDYFKFNENIKSGYRLHYRKRDCLRSTYRWHNETLNIHTHLVGSLLFIYLMFSTWSWLYDLGAAPLDYVMFTSYLLTALQCFVSSTIYHTFGFHSKCTFHTLLALDYSGITALVCGSQIPILYFLLEQQPLWLGVHFFGLALFTWLSYHVSHNPKYQADEYATLRMAAFVLNATYAMVTVAHVAINMDQPALLWEGMHGVVWMYVLYGTGIVVFVSKCPERWGPGRFDYVFHSHQIWHCLVVGAAVSQLYAITGFYEIRHKVAMVSMW